MNLTSAVVRLCYVCHAFRKTCEQAILGDFPQAIEDAILGSSEAHQEQMMQLLSDPNKTTVFGRVVFDMLNGLKG